MKKILAALMLIVTMAFTASARDNYSRNAADLPAAARNTLKNNFKADVSLIKIEGNFGRVSEYEVILTDGTEVSFDRSGNWKEIEVKSSGSVPSAFIPKPLAEYVKKNHKGARIVGLEKSRKGYEASLSNGIEIECDSRGYFLRYDD